MDKPIYIEILETIVKNLVNNPDDVKITRSLDELGVLLKIKVNPQDMGLLIGRKGEMIKAIKTIMKAIGIKNHARLNIKVEEPEPIAKIKTTTEKIIEELKEEK
ncbi:MAG: KH domain-containing protein [Candidatus Pacearchaeota archaeon]